MRRSKEGKVPRRPARWLECCGLALGLGLAALLPSLSAVVTASAEEPAGDADDASARRRAVLRAIPKDPTVLINVAGADMPASTDILNLGRPSRPALERCLADNVDDPMRSYCAELLGYLGDRRSLPALQTALDDWDSSVRSAVVGALARIPDPSSFEPLRKVFRRKDEQQHLRAEALYTLGLIGSPAAVRLLREELRLDPESAAAKQRGSFRATAFHGLWRSRHLLARTTLEGDVAYALRSDDDALVHAATEVGAELRAPSLVAPLVALVDPPAADIRNKAVHALGLIGNPAATRALVDALPRVREARMLNNIAFALERLDRAAFHRAAGTLMTHKQAIIRLNAAFVLGDVKAREERPLLEQALVDPSDLVRTSAAVALGKLGDAQGAPALERLLDDANPAVREEATHALFTLSGERRTDLVHDRLFASAFARSPAGRATRRRAALVLGQAGDPRVRDYLLACYEAGECTLRDLNGLLRRDRSPALTRRLLVAWAGGRLELGDHLGTARPPGLLDLVLGKQEAAAAGGALGTLQHTVDLLGRVGTAAERPALARYADARDVRFRMHVTAALLRLGDGAAATRLLADLDALPADWLPAAARVIARVEEPAARAALAEPLAARSRGEDVDQALAAASVLLAWDPEAGFFRFLDALSAPSVRERDLAEEYLARNRSQELTWVMRRALAREGREYTRDRLRRLLDARS